jgi:hypothetical protein
MAEHTHHLFTSKQYKVLGHIHQILEIPHRCQELLTAEKTPTLSMALPTYEKLVELWKSLALAIPEMSHYIGLAVVKIMEYVSKGRRSKIYALAMSGLNCYKLMRLVHLTQLLIHCLCSSQPSNKVPVDGEALEIEQVHFRREMAQRSGQYFESFIGFQVHFTNVKSRCCYTVAPNVL